MSETETTPQTEEQGSLADLKQKIHESYGGILLSLSNVARYMHLPLLELKTHILEPLVRNRIATANVTATDDAQRSGIAGLAIWANVSQEVDGKIRAQIKAGVFPVRLQPGEWTSGDRNWLLDVIAADRDTASSIVHNLQKALPEGELHLHPMVTQQLSKEALEAMGMTQQKLDA